MREDRPLARADRSLVRASDIGLWATCHRAWWLAKVKGAEHRNPALLAAGTAAHAGHGAQVQAAANARRLGLILLVLAVLALGLLILWQVWL
jgi:hypothetical protein